MIWSADGWWLHARWVESPNFGPRPENGGISLALIHNISLPPGQYGGPEVEQFFTNRLDFQAHPYFATLVGVEVSAHFFLRRDGEALQFVSVNDRAWHAGASSWQGRDNCNDFSVGIELEGTDDEPYTFEQYEVLGELLKALGRSYTVRAIAGHSDVAPGRKSDPGPHFDWQAIKREFPNWKLPDGKG